MMNVLRQARLMNADPGQGGIVTGVPESYNFGQVDGKDLAPEQVATLTEHAKALGLTQEQAAKSLPHLLKLTTPADPAEPQVPASYTFEPVDGKDLAPELVQELSATAKALGLTQKQAQAFAAHELKLRAEAKAETDKALNDVKAKWADELKADPKVGGEKLPATLAASKTALEKFFPGIAKNEAGFPFLSHPEVVKGLAEIGKLVSPDSDFVTDKGNGNKTADPASLFYPTMAK